MRVSRLKVIIETNIRSISMPSNLSRVMCPLSKISNDEMLANSESNPRDFDVRLNKEMNANAPKTNCHARAIGE